MLMSSLLGERYREDPSDALLPSHKYLLRGGYIRGEANGIYSLLPLARRVTRRIEEIIREEMDAIGGQEVLMPVVLPASLWRESGRYDIAGSELARFKDRTGREMVLGMTHEEAAVSLVRGEARSHSHYPFMIYQIQTKFRDEKRPRGGLVRVREFTMKDAYSFHADAGCLGRYFEKMRDTYTRIFERVGLSNVVPVAADGGIMGGLAATEFMFFNENGEDEIVKCPECGYTANAEIARSVRLLGTRESEPICEIETPGVMEIDALCEYLSIKPAETMKAAVFARENGGRPVAAFLRGDLFVSESKLARLAGCALETYAGDAEGLCLGYTGALGFNGDCDVFYDRSLQNEPWLVAGANRENFHISGVCPSRDLPDAQYTDFSAAAPGDSCELCGSPLIFPRGIEVGHIFRLGDKYTSKMGMTFSGADGKTRTPVMGCYGIGVGRLMACIIENRHDKFGPVWPKSVAPFAAHICVLNKSDERILKAGEMMYNDFAKRFETIIDDRGASPGVQFNDADLIGAPVRVIAGTKTAETGDVEIVTRDRSVRTVVPVCDASQTVIKILGGYDA